MLKNHDQKLTTSLQLRYTFERQVTSNEDLNLLTDIYTFPVLLVLPFAKPIT